jgi:hypothetical protein
MPASILSASRRSSRGRVRAALLRAGGTHLRQQRRIAGRRVVGAAHARGALARQEAKSAYRTVPLWINEYGDVDQTWRTEFTVGWRSTMRRLQLIQDGFTGATAWGAFDNFREHDAVWATYGLLPTDREKWTYTPKLRYHAAKQVYAAVPSGLPPRGA